MNNKQQKRPKNNKQQERPNTAPASARPAAPTAATPREFSVAHADNDRPAPAAPSRMTQVRQWKVTARKPELIKVTDRIYSAVNYALSNVLFVITDASVVVIDTTESLKTARACFNEFRKLCQLPVSYIIYTHFHGDHVRGASVFHEPGTKIIAQKAMPEEREKMLDLFGYRARVDALQFGASLDKEARSISLACHPEKGRAHPDGMFKDRAHFQDGGYIPPHILFDEEYKFEEGGVVFELYHTEGETHDHLMVWLPREKTLFPGDLFYAAFPMLGNPMKPDRPILAWAASIERMRALRPEYMVPSHSQPREGAAAIDEVLANYARAIRHVHAETIRLINEGRSFDEVRRRVKLPADLAKLPYLREGYGKVNWAAASVFRQNTGWYSFNPKDLKPLRPGVVARAVLEAVRGADSLLRRARRAIREEMPQLALELTDIVLNARPLHPAGRQVKAQALRLLATRTPNRVERNLYLAEAKAASRRLPPIAKASRQRGHEKRRLQYRVCRQRIGPRRDEAAK